MNSMTGYGKGTASADGVELTVELKSVNHRYLDVAVKLPRVLSPYEELIKGLLAKHFTRGHIDVYVNCVLPANGSKKAVLDLSLAKEITTAVATLANELNLPNDLTASMLARNNDVLTFTATSQEEDYSPLVSAACTAACSALALFRRTEGEKLHQVLTDRLSAIERLHGELTLIAPKVASEYALRLKERITLALEGVAVDEARLLNEVAFFVDKSNIDEELDRLSIHISHAREVMQVADCGKKLDYLVQEMNRESNTICSKANSILVTNVGVELKNEIEKLREQCQNVE